MSKFLITTVETYRVDTENEAEAAIKEAKQDNRFQLTKYLNEYKETKDDAYFKLTLTKNFNNIKEPTTSVDVNYDVENSRGVEDDE